VNLSPQDASAYQSRAAELLKRGDFSLAANDLRQAISLRPGDYHLWSELATVLSRDGKMNEALAAAAEAESLAPDYTSTHWDRGTLLLKVGRRDEAFDEFREASLNRPDLFMSALNFAWDEYGGDCTTIERAVGVRNNRERLILIRFFIRNGKPSEAVALIGRMDNLSKDDRRGLVAEFLKARFFGESYALWAAGSASVSANQAGGAVVDGGFESGEIPDHESFGWQINKLPATTVSIDKSEVHTGLASLRIDWAGNPPTTDETISQLVMVEPTTSYKLELVARAQNLTSGGAPVITVTDVSEQAEQGLGQSSTLPLKTTDWENRSVDFTTSGTTRAVRIALRREACGQPCPIFGSLWLDGFSLKRLELRSANSGRPMNRK